MRWRDPERKITGYLFALIPRQCASCGVHIWREKVYWYDSDYFGVRNWNPLTGRWTKGTYLRKYFCPECGVRIYGEVK